MPPGSPQPAITAAAAVSRCGGYRWWLERLWDPGRPRLLFIGLNPSAADARRDDPTLRRLLGFARGWGYGALEVVNLFSLRTATPARLRRSADPVGAETDAWIRRRALALPELSPAAHPGGDAALGPVIWLGWGNGGGLGGRDRAVLALLDACRLAAPLAVIGWTAGGRPRHPLYAPAALRLLACGAGPSGRGPGAEPRAARPRTPRAGAS